MSKADKIFKRILDEADCEVTIEDILTYKNRFESVNLAIQALKKQLNNGWIPASERLPEEYGDYLVAWRPINLTADDVMRLTGSASHWYEILEYDPDDEALWIGSIEQCDGAYEIIAWQELPEPYKEVEE